MYLLEATYQNLNFYFYRYDFGNKCCSFRSTNNEGNFLFTDMNQQNIILVDGFNTTPCLYINDAHRYRILQVLMDIK